MHPWTAIIAPVKHPSISTSAFSSNQNRLVTGFDIYHSLRYLMSPRKSKQGALVFGAGIPNWSYNIFQHSVSTERSCSDAKIPIRYCPCASERSDLSPNFYVGHSEQPLEPTLIHYDMKTARFKAKKLFGVKEITDDQSKYEVSLHKYPPSPHCNSTIGSYVNEDMLQYSWELIHNITSLYPGSKVSGGIFVSYRYV